MEDDSPTGRSPGSERIGYFLIQVRSVRAGNLDVGVVMEDLDSGFKHRFETAQAVGELLEVWARTRSTPGVP